MTEETNDPGGKRDSFLKAYNLYADAIFRHLYFRLRDRELAKDLMQETFFRAWEYVAKGKMVENLRAFLYQIAKNVLVDEFRKKKTSSLESLMEEGFQPEAKSQGMAEKIDGAQALDMLRTLKDEDREIIILRYIDDLTPQEISEISGDSVNVISVRLHRALEKLRRFFTRRDP